MRRIVMLALLIVTVLLSGCDQPDLWSGSSQSATGPATTAAPIAKTPLSITYICRDLQHPWYRRLSQAMEARCRELGIDYRTEDCLNRDDLFVKYIDVHIKRKASMLIVSPTNEGIGPVVTTKCADAGIPLLGIDTRLKYPDGRNASYIGRSAYACGADAAREMVSLANARRFFSGPVSVLELNISSFYHVNQTVMGFDRTLREAAPIDLSGATMMIETVDDSFNGQYMTLTHQLGELASGRRYIVFAYNDDGALAFYRFALEQGVDFSRILVCGIGGYEPSFYLFTRSGERAASYFAVGTSAGAIGRRAIDLVQEANDRQIDLPESTELPATIIRSSDYSWYRDSQSLTEPQGLEQMEAFYNWKIA